MAYVDVNANFWVRKRSLSPPSRCAMCHLAQVKAPGAALAKDFGHFLALDTGIWQQSHFVVTFQSGQ